MISEWICKSLPSTGIREKPDRNARTVTRFWLEFAQPSLNRREEMGVGTVRTTQFGAVTSQTREAPCVQVETGINLIIARRAYKLQHSHNYPLRSELKSSRP